MSLTMSSASLRPAHASDLCTERTEIAQGGNLFHLAKPVVAADVKYE
jgi:hypothetical protein